jgi:hypothetical protein
MNRIFVVVLSIAMLFALATGTQGAVHSYQSNFMSWGMMDSFEPSLIFGSPIDTWFSVKPDETSFKAALYSDDSGNIGIATYYLNDFTFVELFLDSPDSGDGITNPRGSYLFDFGLFIGLDYFNYSSALFILSPGYRFNLQDHGYVALSLDYTMEPDSDYAEVTGYDLDAKYATDTVEFFAQYYSPTDKYPIADAFYDLGFNIKAGDELTWGFRYFRISSSTPLDGSIYYLGLTWDTDLLILDADVGSNNMGPSDATFYDVSAIFKFGNGFGLGLQYSSYEDDPNDQISIKFKYIGNSSEFSLVYALENDTNSDYLMANYQLKL